MNDTSNLTSLFSSMAEYNSAVNDAVGIVNKSLSAVAIVIISLLWYIEFLDIKKQTSIHQDKLTSNLFMHVAWKYFMAYGMVMLSSQIIDFILWMGNATSHLVESNMDAAQSSLPVLESVDVDLDFFQKMMIGAIQTIATIAQWIAEIVVQILIFLRFLEMYFYKAFAPVLVSGVVSDEFHGVSVGFLKQFVAIVLQGALLILIIKLYNVLATADMFTVTTSGDFQKALGVAFLFTVKSVVYIFVLVGSQSKIRKWMGV